MKWLALPGDGVASFDTGGMASFLPQVVTAETAEEAAQKVAKIWTAPTSIWVAPMPEFEEFDVAREMVVRTTPTTRRFLPA